MQFAHTVGEHRYLQGIYVLHLVIASILLFFSVQYFRKGRVGSFWYAVIMLLGFGALGYHGYWLVDSWRKK